MQQVKTKVTLRHKTSASHINTQVAGGRARIEQVFN